ncbi:S-adenosylmethionine decarboxylase family protein [Ramlibacter sp. MMS24-I3-19]|uniref:S-adenosylmethionine decarboxylase family protein n=1 Tax=Ramlibacter sp. MMS24-I3-19 TaxID=3416606 RepID=UPI003D008ABF
MRGLHLTADLYQCRCEPRWLTDAEALGDWTRQAAEAVGLDVLEEVARPTAEDGSVTAVLVLAHSHVCLHTWPAQRAATVDVYLASSRADMSAKARGLIYALVNRFAPEWTEQRSLDRGTEGE